MAIHASKQFRGLAFDYDASQNPFFKAMIKENLRMLSKLKTGEILLDSIRKATPAYRSNLFKPGVNVIIRPPLSRTWVAPGIGMKAGVATLNDQAKYDAFKLGTGQMIPTMASKTQTQPDNAGASMGGGSVCWLFYSNNEIHSGGGEWLIPYITLGHELIHCLRALEGKSLPVGDKKEEWATTGIKGEAYFITENDLRQEAGLPLRTKYFHDD
jgi:hypothetical protein